MPAQIRPNRMEVSDRFPMVGFAIKADAPGVEAEVVLASDISLFKPENRTMRSAANFYSSREHGLLQIPNGEGIFALPPEVLARFIGQDRLFFGLATGKVGNGGLVVDALPRDGSPYVSLRSFSGRTLRRSFGARAAPRPPVLNWAGDSAHPGGEPVSGTSAPVTNGAPATASAPNGAAQPAPNYDDGFGPMPDIPAREARAFTRGFNAEENLIDFPEDSVRMGPVVEPNPETASAPASAMVAGAEDYAKARRLARDFTDIFKWTVPPAVASAVSARGFSIQPIHAAAGDLNLDFYKVDIARFPDGWDAPRLLEYFITNINNFLDTGNTDFTPYDASDQQRLASADKIGTAFKLDIMGPDNAAVVISDKQRLRWGEYYVVTTIETPWGGSHPVSGHRQFGYYQTANGWVFYTRGADRSTAPIPGTEWAIWSGAESLWQSFQAKTVAFINGNGGEASARTPFSERFNATAVRLTFGNFDAPSTSAMGLSAEAGGADKTIVMPQLPGSARDRATRIGGQFAVRIGEALDLGLAEISLDPLFQKLEASTAPAPLAGAPAAQSYARVQSASWSINWDGIEPVPQPTDNGCWATTLSMLIGWRDQVSIAPGTIAQQCGKDINLGLPWAERASAAAALGLYAVDPQCYMPDAFAGMIENYGPLYVGKMASSTNLSGHAVLVVGMYFDGANHFIRVVDPWDRPVGTPGAPGAYAPTHNTGSRYIMRYEDFQAEYEMAAAGTPAYVQILYAGVPAGRTVNRGTPPAGFAMALSERTDADAAQTGPGTINLSSPPAPVARGMEVAATIAGVVLEQVISNSGDVSWTTDQFRGIKHPNDTAPASPGPFQDATPISLDWPVLSDSYIDDISAFFRIDWQYNGKSIGNVRITNIGTNDAVGWSLAVRGSIMDDNRIYEPNGCAALRITLHYYFTHVIGSDQIALCEIQIFGDGTHTKDCRWTQSSLFGLEQSRRPVLA